MKRLQNFSGLILITFLFSCTNDYIDVKTLPRPDCSGETSIEKAFNKKTKKLLVIPDSPSETIEFNEILGFYKYQYPDSLIRTESELIQEDFTQGMDIYGNINDFENWEKFDLPVKKLANGFEFSDRKYKGKSDAIYYISEDRRVFTGNSMKMIKELKYTMAGFYKYIIFRNGLLSEYGFPDDSKIEIDHIREYNFNQSSSTFFNLFTDRNFPRDTRIDDSVVTDICGRMNIPYPDHQINAFLHDDANSTRLFTNFFFMTGCDTLEKDFMINVVALNGIHINGLDLEMIKHETFHLLWNTAVGSPGEQSFLNEGIQEYYQQLLDSSRIERNIEVLNRYSDHDIGNLIIRGNSQDFWGGPAENNWPIAYNISGLFVKYLIDNRGLETFKKFYTITDREKAYRQIYNMTPEEIENEFYRWVQNYHTSKQPI
jgi:hypothetical protein